MPGIALTTSTALKINKNTQKVVHAQLGSIVGFMEYSIKAKKAHSITHTSNRHHH